VSSTRLKAGDKAPNFTFDSAWQLSRDFHQSLQHHDAVLVFLRYQGCPVCQMEMANLRRGIELINEKNARTYVFLQSSTDTLMQRLKKDDWPFDIVCDPDGKIYELYRVDPGGILRYLHPAGLIAAVKAIGSGFAHRRFEGKETQVPAVFVVRPDRTIRYAYYGRYVSDVPSLSTIAEHLG
jgi:cysteine-S-conjugate beta-lyase